MKFNFLSKWVLVVFLLLNTFSFGQITKTIHLPTQVIDYNSVAGLGDPQITASYFLVYNIEESNIINDLAGVKSTLSSKGFLGKISFPHPNGEVHEYTVEENSTMSDGLKAKFPMIRSYNGYNNVTGNSVKWDVTPHGLHAIIFTPEDGTYYIDPLFKGNNDIYIVYRRNDFQTDKVKECSVTAKPGKPSNLGTPKSFLTCEMRLYRLAVAATVEYTNFQGGTKAQAQAAQVTTMNRVNGVFERDLGITMTIIPNNDLIVYDGATTSDPFTNGTPGSMINQNQTTCDNVIGSANYDIGHVFGTNSGGLAGLGVICFGGQKARGVTGSGAPIGDPFDIDYVAHEMGHQYGANHTQNNNCNRNNATAMEPGSASTIMGYAGICAPDVQNNSDDHFHGISLQEMGTRITNTGCAAITSIANTAPQILATNGNVTVPAGTPFALTAQTFDADGDVLTFCWEQMDNEVSTQPPLSTSTGGPNFRSNPPTVDPTRYFPSLASLASGGPFTWEVVPTVTRTMDFRLSVRDKPLGVIGCNDFADVTVSTDANSGPFIVLYPSATGIVWNASTTETVTWDVANTDVAPVSCSNVDIFLSTDGGLTYPTQLADDVPNTGFANVSVPNVGTTTARIMVISQAGTFFDISDNDFEIVQLNFDYTLSASPTIVEVCQPNDATFTVDIGSIDGYNDPVTLNVTGVPAGATSSFSVDPVTPVGISVLTISNTNLATPGTYILTIEGNSTTGPKTQDVELTISSSNAAVVTLTSPTNGEIGTAIPTNFNWTAGVGSGVTYEIEIATDAAFSSIVDQATGLTLPTYTASGLNQVTTYFWKVRYTNNCATSLWSTEFSFTTSNCTEYVSTNIPINIPTTGTITSTITVPPSGNILDVNLTHLQGTHGRVGQLTFTLTSPFGTSVTLMNQSCGNDNDFNIAFDDDAAAAAIPCPPTDGNTYQPFGSLAGFVGEDPTGVWTLTVVDVSTPTSGQLTAWSLEICSEIATSCVQPDIAITSGNTSICNGTSAALSVTGGNLNDATDWQWYEGSCGGTSLGNGASIVVNPNSTTSYFVRGEGGCTTLGSCAEIVVTVNQIFNETDAATICAGDTYLFGTQTLNTAGTYTEVFSSIDGCDSTVVLTLDVNPIFNEVDQVTICSGDTYIFGTQTLTTAGTYTEVFTSLDGCDSTVVLTLNVVTGFNETDAATICTGDTYLFGAQTLTSGGTYTEIFTSAGGCDSTVVLTLSEVTGFNETDAAIICAGDTYMFGTQTLISSGTYTEAFTSMGGCDSIVVLTLTVNSSYNEIDAATICAGDSYLFGTQTLISSGTYTEVFTSIGGCDSTVVLTLTVNTTYNETDAATICTGDSFSFGTQTLTAAGTYTEVFTSLNECDSIVVLTLDVVPGFNETTQATICAGDSYIFGALTLTNAGAYTQIFTSQAGCDSVVVLTLNVLDNYSTTVDAIICTGDTYTFPDGSTGNTSQTQTSVLTTTNGCDSMIVTNLMVETLDVTVTQTGSTLIANQTNATYQWIDCNANNQPIIGAIGTSYTATTVGNYAVIVTSGSCTDTSDCYIVDVADLEFFNAEQLSVFPNPTNGELTLNWSGKVQFLEIRDALGRLVYQSPENLFEQHILNISHVERGVYFIHVYHNTGVQIVEIVKQ
ncbi:MAG: M12 family metallo-peptidase [Crocinitomicaceae bacterium]|nr:M12 family metallo-peptidase [Crocinitomicaceae bacterium]